MKLEQKAIISIIGIVVIYSIILSYNDSTATGQFNLDVISKQVKEAQKTMQAAQETVMQQRQVVTSSGGGDSNCCNVNRAEIIRLTQEVDSVRDAMVSLQRHVQDLEIAESHAAQASSEPTCSNVGAIANQMNCQQACEVSHRRCTRAEMVRIRLSDNQRMSPLADTCNAALHQNDNTYSYSFSCRCCP